MQGTLQKEPSPLRSIEETHYIELRRDGTTTEWAVGGRPVQISHVRVKDSESADSLSPPLPLKTSSTVEEDIVNQVIYYCMAFIISQI